MTDQKQLTPIGQICKALDTMGASLTESLAGTGINTDRYLATAKMAVQTHADKDRLAKADRNSLYLSIKKCAGDGLMPDNREAALVIYRNKDKGIDEVQYQPMVQGLVKLARNSGEIESINSEVVFKGDEFELSYEMDGVNFRHKPNWTGERGAPILVWATVKLKSGEVIARAYPKSRIDQIATRSKRSYEYDPAKGKDWEEFWRKAAIRNILKYAPKSTALDKAINQMDSEFEDYESETIENTTPPEVPKEPKRTKAAKAVAPEPEPESTTLTDAEFEEVPQPEEEQLPI